MRNHAIGVLLGLALTRVPSADAQASLPEWKLGAAPQVVIGGDGSPRTEFQWITGAWRLPSEQIAVVNGATREIRVFDARGKFLHSFGRKGEGPGEFQQVAWSGHFGDTAIIYDGDLKRITTILLRGTPKAIAEQTLNVEEDRDGGIAGRLNDGRWFMRGFARPNLNLRGPGRIPGYVGVVPASATGSVKWLAELPAMSVFTYTDPSEPSVGPGNIKPVSFGVPAFAAELVAAAAGQTIWFGDGATDSLIRFDATTGIRKTIRLPAGDPLIKAIIDRARGPER